MSPILTGVIASGISGHLTPPWSPEGGYDALATVTLSTSASSITFSGIPQGYKHLQIRLLNRFIASGDYGYGGVRFNGDTGTTYDYHHLYGVGGGQALAYAAINQNWMRAASVIPGDAMLTNNFGVAIYDILDYSSSSKLKTVRSFNGFDNNGTGGTDTIKGFIDFGSGLWRNTAPITSITLGDSGGTYDLAQYSTAALYGVK